MELLNLIINLALIIIGFGLLIFVHELGHFLAAKWASIRTEAFAVGMGPVMLAWRKGIGLAAGSTHARVVAKAGKPASDLSDEELAQHGLGETEYSLRWLPIGGFVKMLGQDDMNPTATSDDRRSYNTCPIGKRMIVVSAGVIMNLLLGVVLFMIAFLVGVKFPAPIVGSVDASMPAGTTMAANAEELGVAEPGLKPGDRILEIGGREAKTFQDVQIASIMSRPDVPVELIVQRDGYDEPLHFTMQPELDPGMGMYSIGIAPAHSTQIWDRDRGGHVTRMLQQSRLTEQGVTPGMKLIEANGIRPDTYEAFKQLVDRSDGMPIRTVWTNVDRRGEHVGEPVEANIMVRPQLELLRYPETTEEGVRNVAIGLFGLPALVEITSVEETSPNHGVLKPGDAVLRFADAHGPRFSAFLEAVQTHDPGSVEMTVVRAGNEEAITAQIVRRGFFDEAGKLDVGVGMNAWQAPHFARPLERVAVHVPGEQQPEVRRTAVYGLGLLPGTRFEAVGGTRVNDWLELREALKSATASALDEGRSETVELTIAHPTTGAEREIVSLELSPDDLASLHALGWNSDLPGAVFEPIHIRLTADGNPFRAVWMGVEETHKWLIRVYLTIDRLFRRTVGVEQLAGPVGIVHIGVTFADRGLMYLVFLLALISVNLAVINFLPLPIVDGGLFLFLVYEKITGKPPSVAFQNLVTIIGIALIATIFVVVTYHDIVRLFTGF